MPPVWQVVERQDPIHIRAKWAQGGGVCVDFGGKRVGWEARYVVMMTLPPEVPQRAGRLLYVLVQQFLETRVKTSAGRECMADEMKATMYPVTGLETRIDMKPFFSVRHFPPRCSRSYGCEVYTRALLALQVYSCLSGTLSTVLPTVIQTSDNPGSAQTNEERQAVANELGSQFVEPCGGFQIFFNARVPHCGGVVKVSPVTTDIPCVENSPVLRNDPERPPVLIAPGPALPGEEFGMLGPGGEWRRRYVGEVEVLVRPGVPGSTVPGLAGLMHPASPTKAGPEP